MAKLEDFYNTTLFHGTSSSNELTPSNIVPLDKARGRTPVPGFYGAVDKEFASGYVNDINILGDPIKSSNGGKVYSFETSFDSPLRVRDIYDEAPQEFIDSIRETFPQQGRVMADFPGMQEINDRKYGNAFNFQEKFDKTLSEVIDLNKTTGKATYNDVYQSISRMHDRFPHLSSDQYEKMGVQRRSMASVEFRRSGIDALFWEEGGGTLSLLDPSDSVTYLDGTKVGRLNIKNMSEVTTSGSPLNNDKSLKLGNASEELVDKSINSSIYDSKGELKKWAHMNKEELTAFRNQVKAEISAGNVPTKDLQYLKDIVLPDMENSLQNLITGAAPANAPVVKPQVKTSSGTIKVGKPANSSTSVPSRTNQPSTVASPKVTTTTATNATTSTDRPIINTGTRVVDDAISLDPAKASKRVIVSGTESGSAHVTAKVSSSSTRAAANTAEAAANSGAAPRVISSTARNLDDRLSKLVAGGIKEAKNLRVAGAAVAALGVGYLALKGREKNQESHRRSLMMQRQGIYR